MFLLTKIRFFEHKSQIIWYLNLMMALRHISAHFDTFRHISTHFDTFRQAQWNSSMEQLRIKLDDV